MTLRILYVSHSFPLPGRPLSNVGGMQRVAVDLYWALEAHPEVEVTPLLLETSWKSTGVRTPAFLLRLLRQIPRIVREREIDVVLFSSMVTASVTPVLQRSIRSAGAITAAIPVGRDVTLPNPIYQRYVPRALRALDLVLPISAATAAACLEREARPERVHTVPCGFDPERAGAPVDRGAARDRIVRLLEGRGAPVTDATRILLSVGRHQERKGFHWFAAEVMPHLTDAVYLVAGEGPMSARVTAAARAAGVEDRVVLPGRVDEELLQLLYSGADLFIMPNIPVPGDMEGFGVVLLEAGAAGLPTVAARLEGIQDVITEGANGHLVPPLDAAAFVAGIERYREPNELREAGERAARHVRERFSWDAVVAQHLEVLRRAVRPAANASGR